MANIKHLFPMHRYGSTWIPQNQVFYSRSSTPKIARHKALWYPVGNGVASAGQKGILGMAGQAIGPRERAEEVKAGAEALGFDACGIASAADADPENRLGRWLGLGYHADMEWMARAAEVRQDVQRKVPGARSVVVVARNYYTPRPAEAAGTGRVARYAWGRDYHRVLKKPLRKLAAQIDALEEGARSYCSVDSGPVLERTWAERAGLAWIGKNSLALRRDMGSWFFLGTVITTVELAPDALEGDWCGTCRACIDACPTSAIVEDGVVDSRRCISYQTIENRGEVPEDVQSRHGGWVFGCDVCQEVCPWNRFARETTETDFLPRGGHANMDLAGLAAMDEASFRSEFEGTPILRARFEGMQRNGRIVLQNQKQPSEEPIQQG